MDVDTDADADVDIDIAADTGADVGADDNEDDEDDTLGTEGAELALECVLEHVVGPERLGAKDIKGEQKCWY